MYNSSGQILLFPNKVVFLSLKSIFVLTNGVDYNASWSSLFAKVHIKGMLLSKALTCMTIENGHFAKETDTFCFIVI